MFAKIAESEKITTFLQYDISLEDVFYQSKQEMPSITVLYSAISHDSTIMYYPVAISIKACKQKVF